ncbi:MAG: hypothetical protein JSS79_02970 [Bacteroidetes bacterium]|nr:hypothetical protein [Bacteroidota bacterium]
MKTKFIAVALVVFASAMAFAQDKTTLGIGLGFDYGGIGANFTTYAGKNFGLFGGLGYAIADVGFNVGAKIRLAPESRVAPFLTGMYGYNAAVAVTNATQYNKVFYGPSFGFGLDIKGRPGRNGFWSIALLVPVRGSDVDNYLADLRSKGVVIGSLPSVALSIGYRFILKEF